LAALAAVLLAALLLSTPLLSGFGPRGVAQEAGTPPAGTPAEPPSVEVLQTRVAVLETEVSLLGGVALELISGRLGGSQATFDADYGPAAGYVDADGNIQAEPPLEGDPAQVLYDVPDVGQIAVTFANERAVGIVVTPPRTADRPLNEVDDADWTLEQANQVGSRFAPADASAGTLVSDQAEPASGAELTVQATSEALAALFPQPEAAPAAGACEPAPAAPEPGVFTATLTFSSPERISAVTYATGGGGTDGEAAAAGALAPTTPTEPGAGRAERGGNAVANSSLGGSVTVNGIQVQAFQIQPNAEGVAAPAEGQSFTALDVALTNQTDHNVTFGLQDMVLVDAEGREVSAICGGVEPAITEGELAPGDSIEGWVTFQAPADFVPVRFVFLVDNARIGFNL
jgi:hypothetical protein